MESSITIKTSRSGHLVPVVNGITLHSTLNPIKESHEIIDAITQDAPMKEKVLLLGLGHGYLLSSIIDHLTSKHKNYTVYVIEPNTELIQLYYANNKIIPRTTILTGDLNCIFADTSFAEFLTSRPQIIQHKESLNANSDFFKKFLTHRSTNDLFTYAKYINDKNLADYLASFESGATIADVTMSLNNSKSKKTHQLAQKMATINYILNLIPSERSSQ